MPNWLHETLALSGVLIAATWLIVRLVQVGRVPPSCSRCEHGSPALEATPSPAPSAPRGVRSKQLRVLS